MKDLVLNWQTQQCMHNERSCPQLANTTMHAQWKIMSSTGKHNNACTMKDPVLNWQTQQRMHNERSCPKLANTTMHAQWKIWSSTGKHNNACTMKDLVLNWQITTTHAQWKIWTKLRGFFYKIMEFCNYEYFFFKFGNVFYLLNIHMLLK